MKILADDNVSTHLRMAIKGVLYRGLDAAYHPGAPTKAVTGRRSNSPTYYGHAGHGKHVSDFHRTSLTWTLTD
jgi:hypothetical protein